MGAGSQPSSGRSSLQLPDYPGGGFDGAVPGQDGGPGPSNWAHWKSADPRTSSTQSLSSPLADQGNRRKLLLVYIHGFMGNDSSFRSFPAHVHSYLKEALAETHVIHTKIYPRYKTYKAIDVARDNFSRWLEPHESPTTDVVLLGHSMGGLLAAEVVLVPGGPPNETPFRHRILGSVSLDAPLLGLHPGIIVSGIASLFRPAPGPAKDGGVDASTASLESGSLSPDPSIYSEVSPPSGSVSPTLMSSPPPAETNSDPYYNPPFFNDVVFKDRGWLRNIAHFANKHRSENLIKTATSHIMSHLEFGGCLADYPAMHSRYNKLRALEDVDDLQADANRKAVRVRFVNYYTASTGIPKEPKEIPEAQHTGSSLRPEQAGLPSGRNSQEIESGRSTPRISVEDFSDSERPELLQELEPIPEPDDEGPPPYTEYQELSVSAQASPETASVNAPSSTQEPAEESQQPPTLRTSSTGLTNTTSVTSAPSASTGATTPGPDIELPAIPDLPSRPEPVDLDRYTDKEARKQAEKEAKRAQKAFDTLVKNRDKAIKERQRLIEKYRRRVIRDAEKRDKEAQKEAQKEAARREKEEKKRAQAEEQELQREVDQMRLEERGPEVEARAKGKGKEKAKKERKFCMLPGKTNGQRDSTWLRVYMKDVDEVGAHCGIFLPGPHYETLVGDVGSRIMGWVHDDATRRAIQELS